MKAACWHGKNEIGIEDVPDPHIINSRDAIVKVTLSAICGSDLHLYDGYIPSMMDGDILGHEFMGEIVEVGDAVNKLRIGDRVVIPFPIACGRCFYCAEGMSSLCENSNPNAWMAEKIWGYSPAGIYGYSHMLGGYAGGQAQYVRVPYADVNHIKIPKDLTDEQVLFLSDIFPTGYMAAEHCNIKPGDAVAIWGCGPVGQFAARSAAMLGAGMVIAIDRFPERLRLARNESGAETINYEEDNVYDSLMDLTGGRGPDACIDAVGMEAHSPGISAVYDRFKQALMLETDRPAALREAIIACRKGGTLSIPGVYGGFADKLPFGALMNKGLTVKTGQTHVHRYLDPLLQKIQSREIDPSFVISHRITMDEVPEAYRMFRDKEEECIKFVLKPN